MLHIPYMDTSHGFVNELRSLATQVAGLATSVREAEDQAAEALRAIEPQHLPSARNLVHYLALRRHDLRELQDRLAAVGLSSLGRAESCVAATLTSVLELLARSCGSPRPERLRGVLTLDAAHRRLTQTTELLLGRPRDDRRVRILVTLPSEAADDDELVRDLVRCGMDAARINCAHDTPAVWERMIAHVRRASAELSTECRVLMDLPGPKLRTGALPPGPRVIKLKPRRDPRGVVLEPARAWLGAAPAPSGAIAIPVPAAWLARVHTGDVIKLHDARGARRTLHAIDVADHGVLVETRRTTYVHTGVGLRHGDAEGVVGDLPQVEQPLLLRPGDLLRVTRDATPGGAGPPPHISCTLPQVFLDVRSGDRIWFDDGAIGGRVRAAALDGLEVEITDASPDGSKLRSDKGINLPDTKLRLPPIDARDEANLAFIAAHADLIGYSFVRRPSDVIELQDRLAALGHRDVGVVLKIETRAAFENLPALLLTAMRRPVVGVMIARGDLAVECGWERLAELQEEILWICEAAHLPVIWATQVLEQLAKQGRPSRAEITDAAMAERAECVMLNKGAHLVEAVQVLDDILRRMQSHQAKKRSMLRRLALADHFAGGSRSR
jgi:pyruvate kinase